MRDFIAEGTSPQGDQIDAYCTAGLSPPEAALELAVRGWRIFPIAAGAKKPPLIRRGFHGATTSERQVRAWWHRWPKANIGIRPWSDMAVVDVDPRHGGSLEAVAALDLPGPSETRAVSTAGGGYHLYYQVDGPVKNSTGKLGPGLDVKAASGYVVAPPSTTPDGAYRWLEPLLPVAPIGGAILASSQTQAVLHDTPTRRNTVQGWAPFDPDAHIEVGEGGRHEALVRWAGWLRSRGCDGGQIEALLFELNEDFQPPIDDEAEILSIAKWAGRLAA